MFTIIKRWLKWLIEVRWLWMNVQITNLQHQRDLLLLQDRYKNMKRLNHYEYQVFSQNGEDGILSEIFKRIEETNHYFVEIGVENGLENNTTFLLLKGWKGAWIEGNRRSVAFIKRHFAAPIYDGSLSVLHNFVSKENVLHLLKKLNVPVAPDLLSIDIDRNTYFVLRAILGSFQPRVIVLEYNAMFPPDIDWKVEYAPNHMWNRSSYFGASLKAYELLGKEFGYLLVGCDLCGINAFFVRADLCSDKFAEPFTAENHFEPIRYFISYRRGYPRAFTDLN